MKLSQLYVADLLGAQAVDVRMHAPIQLFAGRNAQGKSAIADAVRLALCAQFARGVSMKKDAPTLIREGADNAVCQVVTVDGDDYRVSITKAGKITDSYKGREHDPRLPYVLDGQRIASMSASERRTFLAGVLGMAIDHNEVARLLVSKGLDEARVKRIAPLLRMGYDEPLRQAKDNASQSRGAWKSTTGENYGSVKAATWSAPVPAFSLADLEAMQKALATADTNLGEAQQRLGALEAASQTGADVAAERAALRPKAELLERRQTKLAHDKAELEKWEQTYADTAAKAGVEPKVGLIHDMGRALHMLVTDGHIGDMVAHEEASVVLNAYAGAHGDPGAAGGDPDARQRLPQVQSTRDLMRRAVDNAQRDVDESTAAVQRLAALDAVKTEAVDAAALTEAREAVQALQGLRTTRATKVRELENARDAGRSADEKTRKAAELHADVVAWEAIADALSPNGVQAELLAAALQPLADRLGQSAADLDWPLVTIDADMAIRYGGRPYALLSESEQWRADAMLAEAVAHVSGLRVLILDRMDRLDLPGREQLIKWLDVLAQTGEVDTVMVMATLKALPADLPDTFESHWVDAGICQEVPLAAAA